MMSCLGFPVCLSAHHVVLKQNLGLRWTCARAVIEIAVLNKVRAASARLALRHGHVTSLGLGEFVDELIEPQR